VSPILTDPSKRKVKIAVIGGGISGIYAAYQLQKDFEVVLYEAESKLGGHAHAVRLPSGTLVDTGFMVFNERSYPRFMNFLKDLGVQEQVQFSEMSFSFLNETKNLYFCLNRGVARLFHQKRNLLSPSFYRHFFDLMRFRKKAWRDLSHGSFPEVSLEEYLSCFSSSFVDNVLIPICVSVWSVSPKQILAFPAKTIAAFLANHGYLHGIPGHRWRTLKGSSQVYIDAFQKSFLGEIRTGVKVGSVTRTSDGVFVDSEKFDAVICALPANKVLAVIKDPNPEEQCIFSKWNYERTQITLHTDSNALGKISSRDPKLWSSWNIFKDLNGTSVTYYLNRVQALTESQDYFVTLGSAGRINPAKILKQSPFSHPVFDFGSVETQKDLWTLENQNGIFYCGSYFGYGFHEDAINSALATARACSLHFLGTSQES
jgi:predicted NAD/FAD-binding protein